MDDATREHLPAAIGAAVEGAWSLLPPEAQLGQAAVGLLAEASSRLGLDWLLRNRRTLQTAAASAELTEEELLRRLADDPARRELLRRVLEASGPALSPGKVEALGKVLAHGLDDARVDEALLLADALADVQPPHAQVLAALLASEEETERLRGVSREYLVTKLPGHRSVLRAVLGGLVRHGLVEQLTPSDGMASGGLIVTDPNRVTWRLGDLGRVCLALLDGVAPADVGA